MLDPALHLVMAGPDETGWVAKLQATAAARGISDRVTFTGMLGGDLKWGAYDAAEVFVLPSHQENFGIVVAEALASDLPVLTTYNVNIWREVRDAGAGFIEADTQAGIDQLLAKWLALSSDQRQEMRVAAGACFARYFEIKQVTGKLVDALLDASSMPKSQFTFVGSVAEAWRRRVR